MGFNKLDADHSGAIACDEFVDNLMHLMRAQSVDQMVHQCKSETKRVHKACEQLNGKMEYLSKYLAQLSEFFEREEQKKQQIAEIILTSRASLTSRTLLPPEDGNGDRASRCVPDGHAVFAERRVLNGRAVTYTEMCRL